MNQAPARSATAWTGKSVLAIVAIFSLLLSLFAMVRPVAADHSGFDHQPLPIETSTFEKDSGECEGVELEPGQVLLHWIANQQNVTEPITLTLFLEGDGELSVDSYKWNEPGHVDSNITHHFEFIVDSDIVVQDLDISTGEGNVRLSHVCRSDENGGEEGVDLVLIKQDLESGTLAGVGFTLGDGDEILTDGSGQVTFESLTEGSWTLTETSNPDADCETGGTLTVTVSAEGAITVTDDDEADGLAIISFDAQTNTLVVSNDCEDEGEGDTVSVSIMKHLCTDVSSVEEFESVEAEGTAAYPGNAFAPLAFTVVACPTIVLSGDVPTSGAVSGGNVDFDFTVLDADGTQVLSSDGMFEQGALCETDVNVDADGSGTIDADVCLDTSHYMFEVVDGVVVITETQDPEESTGLGTIRFTPGSEDETALTTSIGAVETTGVITLDTSMASEAALADGTIMLHVYNFAEAPDEGEQPGGGQGPGQNETPREGTQGSSGGPGSGGLPNTALTPTPADSAPAALLALLMLAGLGAAGYAVRTEAQRRR